MARKQVLPVAVCRTDGADLPGTNGKILRFATIAKAEAQVEAFKAEDPEGVERGEYSIDVPEDMQAEAWLRKFLKEGQTIFCRMVANHDAGRSYSVFAIGQNDEEPPWIEDITAKVAAALNRRYNKSRQSLYVPGHGFNAVYHLVQDELSSAVDRQLFGRNL